MALATAIKSKIKANLDELKLAGVLGEVEEDDLKKSILDRDFASFPVAVLTTPAISGGFFTNSQNERVHTFAIWIIEKEENVSSPDQIETLAEAILDKFDNDYTLGGTADAGCEPSSTPAEPITFKGRNYICFQVVIKAKAIKTLG